MAAAASKSPRVILGTMTFGSQTNKADTASMLLDFCRNPAWKSVVRDSPEVDTAIMYVGGKTEALLGEIIHKNESLENHVSVASKANPFTKDKNLSPSGLREQLEASLESLQQDSVDIYYLHAPDVNHAIEPTLEAIQTAYSEGKFRRFAVSNFTAWETVYIHHYMQARGYVVPTIYQGMYNAITRQVESELFPALRKLGMAFYAYNPLAGGMLSGKHEFSNSGTTNQPTGRFSGNTFWAQKYRERYQQDEQKRAVDLIREALDGEPMADAALRWMVHHSGLTDADGIIVGASNLKHFSANMKSLTSTEKLPESVVRALDEASRICAPVCPAYARGWSGRALGTKTT